ncbi:epoxide hydrolase family protein [Micromonospora radicis]|uniref:Epoxide hydrolase n=1 Tax=Micromonospora radicis TaxID=1894971 RepID=A0A418MQ20_9ACTN|nr:epoxide hydrolase family protein [Micromonospora radicis]RIV34576.1 epoxide hydrolase [Micromonospora radicis]
MTSTFRIEISDEVIADLHRRLDATRLPPPLPGAPRSRGVDLAELEELLRYWRQDFDWRAVERRWNAYPQFVTSVDGVDLHYFHIKGPEGSLPLMLVHGWPGSFLEFGAVVDILTARTPADGPTFDLIIPSLPGYGFSGKPTDEGWNVDRVADAFTALLTDELGYDRYFLQGGDWGFRVTTAMAQRNPEHVIGLHLNLALALPPEDGDPAEIAAFTEAANGYAGETGYLGIQETKPMSLGVGQADSPAGLAAWILEKFETWSDSPGGVLHDLDADAVVANIMLYWVTNTAASAMNFYFESAGPEGLDWSRPVQVPVGYARFPREMGVAVAIPDEWLRRRYHLVHLRHHERGGHFAALERPQELAGDVLDFVTTVQAS